MRVAFGEGDAPWKKIFEAVEKTGGVEYYLIEQETGGTRWRARHGASTAWTTGRSSER